jgi:hypothetical protein
MHDPDNSLHQEFLPFYARVPIKQLADAYGWATASDHPECRYAVWAIARNHARAPRTVPHTPNHTIMWNFHHLAMILDVFNESKLRDPSGEPEPDRSKYHCTITRAGAARGDPEAEVLAYRILRARRDRCVTSWPTKSLPAQISNNTKRLVKILLHEPDFGHYPVPLLSDILTEEEIACHAALCWAMKEPSDSYAFGLFQKIQKRTDELTGDKNTGTLQRNMYGHKYYIRRTTSLYLWCIKVARFYLESHSPPAI